MAVEFSVKIISEGGDPPTNFIASSTDASGTSYVFVGHGENPYDALHNLIDEFENADLYRPD